MTGRPLGWGARQEVDQSHAAFRFHAERVIRAVVGRYANHPAVVGFQVDNVPGLVLPRNEGVFQRFVDELRHQYGTVEELNRARGLVYWSRRLSTWADLWRPDGNAQPQYSLAWRRFRARLVTEFIGWQAAIVRELARPDQFVTTCIDYPRAGVEDDALAAVLDVTSGNAYYEPQDAVTLPDDATGTTPPYVVSAGVWSLYQKADRMWSSRQEPFLVTETNAAHIIAAASRLRLSGPAAAGGVGDGVPRRADGRVLALAHHALRHRDDVGGILPHSGEPGRVYREVARIGEELSAAGALVAGVEPDADVASSVRGPRPG